MSRHQGAKGCGGEGDSRREGPGLPSSDTSRRPPCNVRGERSGLGGGGDRGELWREGDPLRRSAGAVAPSPPVGSAVDGGFAWVASAVVVRGPWLPS